MPLDGWAKDAWINSVTGQPVIPRAWQPEAHAKFLLEYAKPKPDPSIVRAVTGAGKAILMAQIAASCELDPDESIVVSTTSTMLVEQLEDTFKSRLDVGGFMSGQSKVGTYYTHGKNITAPVIIACTPSIPELAKRLLETNRKCALWMPDECHKTRCSTIMDAYSVLQPFASLGMTATPFRSKASESLTLFDKVLFAYTAERAIKDGVVVPFRTQYWDGGDSDLDSVCVQMTELASGPGVYNAVSVDDAEIFSRKLNDQGLNAKPIHCRMPKAERKRRLEELRNGSLYALVHVSILSEGADMPWLRWLCMRRPVGSRVRFIQELGRILRSYVDPITGEVKTEAVVYDPHCLTQDFALSYKEVLGGDANEDDIDDEDTPASEKKKKHFEQLILELMKEIVNVKAGKKPLSLTPLAGYLCELVMAFDICGLVERKVSNREWRRREATDKQAQAAKNLLWTLGKRYVPKSHQKPLELLTGMARQMNRGMASDLVTVMQSLANFKKWPDLKILDRSANEAVKAHEKRQSNLITKPFSTPQIPMGPKPAPVKKPEQPKLFD